MNIYESITAIMEEVPAIGKNKKNTQQNFNFRGIDDVMNALQPLLSKHKVFIVPEILEQTREERTTKNGSVLIYSICKIKYKFYAEDGTFIEAVTIGEGMDSGDKATNKAMSIAMKYALFQVFCIPTEEMKDPDGESHDNLNPKNQNNSNKKNHSNPDPTENEVINLKMVDALDQSIANNNMSETTVLSVLMKYGYKSTSEIQKKNYMAIVNELKGEK